MKGENNTLLILSGIIILGLISALVWTNTKDKLPSTANGDPDEMVVKNLKPFDEVPVVTDEKLSFSDPTKHYGYEVHFPRIALVGHPELAKGANDVIAGFVRDAIEGFTKDVDEMYSPNVPVDFASDYSMRWSALLLSPTIISIRFDYSEYIAGSAHPNSQSRILNYNIEKFLLLQTTDLFASSTEALPFLSSYSREKLKDLIKDEPKGIFNEQAIPGTEPTHENFQEVGITKNGLLVIFNPYQVAPYSRGTIQLEIKSDELTDRIAPEVLNAMRMAETNISEATVDNGASTTGEFGD